MSDAVLRDAARLVRAGMAPTFVAMLDDAGKRTLVMALHPLPECGSEWHDEPAAWRAAYGPIRCSKVVGHDPPHHGKGVRWGHEPLPRGNMGDYISIDSVDASQEDASQERF